MTRTDTVEALAVSRAAKMRWTSLGLSGRALRFLMAVDVHLGGYEKLEDSISNDQLIDAANLKWKSNLIEARAEAVAKGAIVYVPSTGGRSVGGAGRPSTYRYCDEDIRAGQLTGRATARPVRASTGRAAVRPHRRAMPEGRDIQDDARIEAAGRSRSP